MQPILRMGLSCLDRLQTKHHVWCLLAASDVGSIYSQYYLEKSPFSREKQTQVISAIYFSVSLNNLHLRTPSNGVVITILTG